MRFANILRKFIFPFTLIIAAMTLTACKAGFETDGSDGGNGGNGEDERFDFVGPSTWRVELDRSNKTFKITHRAEPGATVDMTLTGTYEKLSSGFTRLTITDPGNSTAQLKATITAVEIGDEYMILEPIENSSDQLIATVMADDCPENDLTGNWIMYDTATAADASKNDQWFFGSYVYLVSDGSGQLESRYDLETFTANTNRVNIDGDTCNKGISETDTTVQYVSPNVGALVHNNTDDADTSELLFVMDTREVATRAELDNSNYIGLYYDSTFSVGAKSIPVSISCTNGECEMKEVENITSGASSTTSYNISFVTPGSVGEGFATGTLANANDVKGNIACSVDIKFLDEDQIVWACVGQAPTDNTKFINLFVTTK